MPEYQKSSYAANKYRKGIVYRFADGNYELTAKEYIEWRTGRPITQEEVYSSEYAHWFAEFEKFKRISDLDYLEESRQEYRECRRNISWDNLPMYMDIASERLDIAYEESMDLKSRQELAEQLKRYIEQELNPLQRRRASLYFLKGQTTYQIALNEGVNQNSVWKTIQSVKKKLSVIFEKKGG